MESLRKFRDNVRAKRNRALDEGDVFLANRIQANIMVGLFSSLIVLILPIILILNELDILLVDKLAMRVAVLTVVAIQIPIAVLDKKYYGDKPWLRNLLMVGLLLVSVILEAMLSYNVTMVLLLPVVMSIRYFDPSFTKKVYIASVIGLLLAVIGNAWFGVINLNFYRPPVGTTITIETTIRQALKSAGYNRMAYFKRIILRDFFPKLLLVSFFSYICHLIAKKGREMIVQQDSISKKQTRIETELALATEIQKSMLPTSFPAFPDHAELDVYAMNITAKEVGGDFYDYFPIDSDHIALVMADVSGKGIGSALFMNKAKTIVKDQLTLLKDPAAALEKANVQLCENNKTRLFVTVWAGIYEISTGTMTYTNAGHNPPLLMKDGKPFEYLHSRHGLFLGAVSTIRYKEDSVRLTKGDELFLYTDGVTEATNASEELYGESRLLEFLNAKASEGTREQIDALLTELSGFQGEAEQFDDVTMLGMKIR